MFDKWQKHRAPLKEHGAVWTILAWRRPQVEEHVRCGG